MYIFADMIGFLYIVGPIAILIQKLIGIPVTQGNVWITFIIMYAVTYVMVKWMERKPKQLNSN